MLNHNDFEVNEAWVVFKLNESSFPTAEGLVDIYALMDIGSGYIFGHVHSMNSSIPEKSSIKELFLKAWEGQSDWAYKLIFDEETEITTLFKEYAKDNGITTEYHSQSELKNITNDPKTAFAKTVFK